MSQTTHQFHIPVMGTAFTIDSPIKIARFGISSVISIGDDELCENMREYYARFYKLSYSPIAKFESRYRARRICAYLDLVHHVVESQLEILKALPFEPGNEISKYFELMFDKHPMAILYRLFLKMPVESSERDAAEAELRASIVAGSIDVNIMTKLDRLNYDENGQLMADEFSDACAALEGYATSQLSSSIVFSAGFNRRLYAHIESFDDFFPDASGFIKKKVILKVSDLRSSLIQGRFLAKKGVWISEHRIESGLNCGGHAFASDGFLLGPILEEFKLQRAELSSSFYDLCNEALAKRGRAVFGSVPPVRVTVQGGIGTHLENQFLFDYYDVDGTGWATPFLLVPEVTTLDYPTRLRLAKATQDDLFLSEFSPLGVPFNSMRDTPSEEQKKERVEIGRPGSPCPKGHLVSNLEFTKKPICTAAVTYQKRKIEQLNQSGVSGAERDGQFHKIVVKSCLCEDLAAGALIEYGITNKRPLKTAVCPGPNLAYFSKISTLAEMAGHIYGRLNLLNDTYRPNMFMSELKMYIDYLDKEIRKALPQPSDKDMTYFEFFKANLADGIAYYRDTLIPQLLCETDEYRARMLEELLALKGQLDRLFAKHGLVGMAI